MKDFYVNRYSDRGSKLRRLLNSRKDFTFIGISSDRRHLHFKIPKQLHISFSRKGKIKLKLEDFSYD